MTDTSTENNALMSDDNSDELNTPNISPEKDHPIDTIETKTEFTRDDFMFNNSVQNDENKPTEDDENSNGFNESSPERQDINNGREDSVSDDVKDTKPKKDELDTPPTVKIKKEPQTENGDSNDEKPELSKVTKETPEADRSSENSCDAPPASQRDNVQSGADDNDDAETVAPPPEEPRTPMISVRKVEDLISRTQVNGSNNDAHFPCADCPGLAFQSPQELAQHQAATHQSSVQQLQQQVQRIPAQFHSPSYRVPTPPRANYMSPPPMVPYYQPGMVTPHEGTTQTIGSGVVLSSVPSVPNLPPGIQLSKRPAAQPIESSSPKQRREEIETRRLPDSITLSRTPAAPPVPARNSVTDMLANRGITVVPSGRSPAPTTPTLPRALSSAISITPSSQQHNRQNNFAVPQTKPVSRLLTVDLTKESDSPPRRHPVQVRGRIRNQSTRSICQICDKAFPTPQELQAHMACHRGGAATKLAYECRECTAQYPTEAGLQAHRQKYHGAGGPSPDMAIPVVDLKQGGVLSRLAALGIRSVIPLSQLHSGSGNGLFGLPVVAIDAANNPAICNIGGLGASNLLPLGPLKNVTFNNNMR